MNVLLLGHSALVCAGLVGLWKMGDIVVQCTVNMARAFRVTTFFIGFVILALAADIPELAVAIIAAFRGISEVAAGDIIGANFSDVALVIGIALLIAGTVTLEKHESKRLVHVLTLSALVLAVVFMIGTLYPVHGLILMAIYGITLVSLWYQSQGQDEVVDVDESSNIEPRWLVCVKLLASLAVIMGISYVTLSSALEVAVLLSMPLETVGATIFGVGTSLPELALSLNALKRKEYGLALGTTLGTVLEQTTLVLGTLTLLSSKPVEMSGLFGASLFMFVSFIIISYGLYRYSQVDRKTGFALVTLFFAYLAFQAVQSGAV